jgi:arylsulfate sulfotransferase
MKPLLAFAFAGIATAAPPSFQLLSNKPSPLPVGTPIGLTVRLGIAGPRPAGPLTAGPPPLAFRYSVSRDGGPFRIIRDFSQQQDFVWAPALHEHQATVRLTVRDNKTQETADSDLQFRIVSRVKGTTPVITRTAHPLVPVFSAPPCPGGSQFRVGFRREGDETVANTPLQPCRPGISNNVYIAGLYADTEYRMRSEVVSGANVNTGAWLPFHTGLPEGDLPPVSILVPRADRSAPAEPILLRSMRRAFATDLNGETLWYSRSLGSLTRVLPGGRFLLITDGANSANTMRRSQILREADLVGNTIRETNISRVAEQLGRYGIQSDCRKGGKECVTSFHHDAVRLPNGHTLALAGLERIFPAGTQGSKEPIDILGDLVIELDEDFQAVGVWKSFDHLNVNRAALDKGTCKEGPAGGGCTPVFLAAQAQAWLHSNSLNFQPESGDFLISMRAQSWVAKVDWKHGKGSGKILWRLGNEGDFVAKSSDPNPWFGSQHDPGFDPPGSNTISLFDNGNARYDKDPKAHSRGQVWQIDEQARTATLLHNADMGVYSMALGSAQKLKSGGYTFQAGFVNPASVVSRSVETSADGEVVYAQQVEGTTEYRSFRLADMYSAPSK